MPRLLELFSGTGSVGRAFTARGWEVVSVDLDPRANATFCCDVAQWDCTGIGEVDAIWTSPPCTHYSAARSRGGGRDLETSDALVRKTLEIAAVLGDPPLFIENPHSGRLKDRGILSHLNLQVLDYCKYGMPYRKRTAVWTNTGWHPDRALCKHDCPASEGKKHTATAQRGPPGPCFTQQELYRIPAELCEEIALFCDRNVVYSSKGQSTCPNATE